jgi:2-methylcitrate dehydratase PrpD
VRLIGQTKVLIANEIADWTASFSVENVSSEVRHAAKRCIIDTVGVIVAGSCLSTSKRVYAHVAHEYGTGPCTIMGTGQRTSATGAAVANGTAAHVLDMDDTCYTGGCMLHGSAIILPATLAASEHCGRDGSKLLEAFILGSEAAFALGSGLTDSHYLKGWWASGTIGAIGAAVSAAKLLDLGAREIATAIGLTAIQTNGMIAMLGYDAKPILAGQAARLGLECALLAMRGNSAPERAFEDRRGFLSLMNDGKFDRSVLADLGVVWRLVDGIAVKRAPVCSAAHAAIELTESLIRENGLDRTQISHVRCEVPHIVAISLIFDRPANPQEAQFSMTFAIGCILAFGKLGPEQISDETLSNEVLKNAMAKVEMVMAEDLNAPEILTRNPECARVTITASDGKTFSGFLETPLGLPSNPFSDQQISDKFRDCVSTAGWTNEECEAALSQLWNIENLRGVTRLVRRDSSCDTH